MDASAIGIALPCAAAVSDGSLRWKRAPRSTETLLLKALTHVTEHWDGRVADAPAPSAATRRSPRPANGSVHVLETRQVGDDLWLRIAILDPGHCDVVEPRVVAAGWIPAYARSGDPTVWFHSRGC